MEAAERGFGEDLRALRLARGLSLGAAADRAGLSKSALMGWESGRSRPRGPGLARLLDVLAPDARRRARILYEADPAHARIVLANTPIGAPVDVGAVIRAMRGRRGMTQADLARAAGVSQAAVARWEAGDDAPRADALHRACFELGASAEELAALACAQGEPLGEMPNDPETVSLYIRNVMHPLSLTLREIVALGFEAELWRRSMRDERWDPLYCGVLGSRANELFCAGRLGESEEAARRALRRATTPEARLAATGAVGALVAIARHEEAPPAPMAERLQGWIERLPTSAPLSLSWMVWERARLLAQMGLEDEALYETERAVEMLWQSYDGSFPVGAIIYNALKYRSETLLETSRPGRAAALVYCLAPAHATDSPGRLMVAIPPWHAAGEPVPEVYIDEIRAWAVGGEGDSWIHRERLARMERDQARLVGAA